MPGGPWNPKPASERTASYGIESRQAKPNQTNPAQVIPGRIEPDPLVLLYGIGRHPIKGHSSTIKSRVRARIWRIGGTGTGIVSWAQCNISPYFLQLENY